MKSSCWMTSVLLSALLGGCGTATTDTYCDVAAPVYFERSATVDWLLENDKPLVTEIVVHNETYERTCN
jgi:hypothetical protein